jgi:hypothetical protein
MGSSRALKCAMLHDGEMRRSLEAFSDVISRGMSAAVAADIILIADAVGCVVQVEGSLDGR